MDVSKFAETIARLRKEKGLTQKQLAEQFGVSDRSVSKWERGETMPDVSLLPDIADFFGVSVDDLLRSDAEIEAPDAEEGASRAKQEKSVFSACRRHKTVLIVADALFASALIGWAVAGLFTDNGWKDVAFSAVILFFSPRSSAISPCSQETFARLQMLTRERKRSGAGMFCLRIALSARSVFSSARGCFHRDT